MTSWIVYPSQRSEPPDFTDALNTSTRRHHSKSRAGCTVCKKRRIKCDETKPACRQCVDYGRQCSYLDKGLQGVSGSTRQLIATADDGSNDELFEQVWEQLRSRAQLCSLAELSIQKASVLALLRHFTGCKDKWLAAPAFQQTLQQHGVKLGLQSDYLLHAILAVTASHLQYLDPLEPKLKLISGFYYSLSLGLYRETLNNIQIQDGDAIFACGALHAILFKRNTIHEAIVSGHMLGGLSSLLVGLKSIKSFPASHGSFGQEDQVSHSPSHGLFPSWLSAREWTTEVDEKVSNMASRIAKLEGSLTQLVGNAV
jgi:hypothetical protein